MLSHLRAVCPFVKPIIASEPNDGEEDADEGDAPPEPCELPPGFAFAALPPTEAALCFTKQSVLSPEADELVG